ncbi:hypothetical protein Taro_024430 [Colocasia esculenta]|uniref:Hypoxanthine phosphoribosyltransferase n=1 Tax=Colocasia esculenta TaxID=4460 RepID=A0A843VHH2_COLES|nr:hypothetical protein [Colocasia esculenta]
MVPASASATATRWWRRLAPVPQAMPLSPPASRRRFHVGDWCRPPFPTSFAVTDLGPRRGQVLISFLTSRAPSSAPLRGTPTVARSWEEDLERILWTEDEIAARVSEIAAEISEDIKGCGAEVAVVGVATGAFVFLADLVRRMGLPVAVDLIRVESYGSRTESNGAPAIVSDVRVDVEGKHVILVEDIVDTGNTLSFLISHMKSKGARAVSVCTFLDKPGRRKVQFELVGDGKFYRGFVCPDCFVVGYGMDFSERCRYLPFVAVLKPEKYT